jgi:hypothetical protein
VPNRPPVLSIRPHPLACRSVDWLNPVTPSTALADHARPMIGISMMEMTVHLKY